MGLLFFYNETKKQLYASNRNFDPIMPDRDQWIEISWYKFDRLIEKRGIIPDMDYKG